jgi:hypothetical protein
VDRSTTIRKITGKTHGAKPLERAGEDGDVGITCGRYGCSSADFSEFCYCEVESYFILLRLSFSRFQPAIYRHLEYFEPLLRS